MTSANHPGAHRGRCATSHLSEPRLVDAAHIFIDADERLEQPVISNGLPLTKIHTQLISIDPDFQVHVSERLLDVKICQGG